jgi:DNA modification methylase
VYKGAQSRIWGGDPACEHKWDTVITKFYKHEEPHKYPEADDEKPSTVESAYCTKCGAWLGALGLEPTVDQYVDNMVLIGNEIMRVLHPSGTWWLVIGDNYSGSGGAGGDYNKGGLREGQPRYPGRNVAGLKPKDLVGVPWRLAFALQHAGWYLRSDIIWHKPNAMPSSVTDRPTSSHEHVFLFSKQGRYYYDIDAIREPHATKDERNISKRAQDYRGKFEPSIAETVSSPRARQSREGYTPSYYHPSGKNKRDVWIINTKGYTGAHFAAYPPDLVEPCIKAGSSEFGVCPVCKNPWERNMVAVYKPDRSKQEKREYMIESIPDRDKPSRMNTKDMESVVYEQRGWKPTCNCVLHCPDKHDQHHWKVNCWACDHEGEAYPPGPAIVFDPFLGTGTTLQVARVLGRVGLGTDLSLDYLQQARKRLLFDKMDEWEHGIQDDSDLTDLPMFGGDNENTT